METLDNTSIEKRNILPIKERWNLLLVSIGLIVISIAIQIFDAVKLSKLVGRIENGDYGAALEFARMQREGITPMKAFAFLIAVTVIVFICMWVYRAAQNVHMAGIKFLNYSPGWNVGWFFIPLANVVMPLIALRETVKATFSLNNPTEYDSWNNNRLPVSFTIWSVCFAIRMFIIYAAFAYGMSVARQIMSGNPDALVSLYRNSMYLSYFSLLLSVIELVALYMFTKQVTELQEEYRKD